MKIISKFISFFLIVVAVSACNTKEIDNPDNMNPDKSLVSDIKLTANITQTRVNYSVNGGLLTQCWAEGDVIYGYYGSGTGSKVILTVEEVVDGIATLKPESGYEGFVAALKNQIKTQEDKILPFGLVYTGVDALDEDVLFTKKGKIDVLLSNQDIGQIPACLQSVTYKIIPGKSEEKIVQFIFSNECAILEIESLTGIAEDAEITEGSFMELSSIKVSSSEYYNPLYNHIEFSYNGGLQSSSESSDYYNNFVTVSSTTERPLRVDDKGNIVDGQGNKSCIRIAVYPQGDVILKVTATPSDDEEHPFISEYEGTLSTGNCYIISSKEVVAKTEDGLYFTTVKAAFDHARVLSKQGYFDEEEENVVTLLAPNIYGLGENSDSNGDRIYEDLIINIDFPVTLDLNNCDLQLCCDPDNNGDAYEDNRESGGFYVAAGANFTITDGSEEGEGYIHSNCECPIIDNLGLMTVNYGCLYNYVGNVADNGGTLTVCGGELYSSANVAIGNSSNGTVVIEDGEVDSKNGYAIKSLGGILTITGGSIYSTNQSAIICDGGSIDIDGEDLEIYTNATTDIMGYNIPAIIIKTEDQKNASFDMDSGHIHSSNGAIVFDGNVRADISGGLIESNVGTTVEVKNGRGGYYETAESTPVPNCTISGGTIGRKTSYETGYSLNILDGSSCKISGGIIYNLCTSGTQGGAISCYTNTKGDGTSLTVEWPKDGSGNDITSLGEPLIYSSGADVDATPIDANKISNDIDYALIYLNGGYLYHNRNNSTCFFSCDNINDEYSSNIASFGEVYSNTNAFRYLGTRSIINQFFSGIKLNDRSTRSLSSQTLSGEAIVIISNSFLGELQFKYRIY